MICHTMVAYCAAAKKESDLVFAVYQSTKTPVPANLYIDFRDSFGKTLDRMNKGFLYNTYLLL
jgi:hypothetical protein